MYSGNLGTCFWKLRYIFWKYGYVFLEIRVWVSGNSGMSFWKFGYGFLDIWVLISGYFAGWRTGPAGAGPRLDPDPDPDGAGRGRSGQVGAGRGAGTYLRAETRKQLHQ